MNKPSNWNDVRGDSQYRDSKIIPPTRTGRVGPMGRVGGATLKGKDKPESGHGIGADINGCNLVSFRDRRMGHKAR